jgi:hypothetical protein
VQRKLLGIISADFDVTRLIMVVCSAFLKYLKKLVINVKKGFESVRREA